MRTPALDEQVKYHVGKGLRRMTRRDAIMRFARDRALSLNDPRLTSLLLEADRKLRQAAAQLDYGSINTVIGPGRGPGANLEGFVQELGLGKLIYIGHNAQRVALTPELVTFALRQLGDRRLSRDEQKLVVAFTLTPNKVEWPDWWEPDLRHKKVRVPPRFFREDDAEWDRALTPPNNC